MRFQVKNTESPGKHVTGVLFALSAPSQSHSLTSFTFIPLSLSFSEVSGTGEEHLQVLPLRDFIRGATAVETPSKEKGRDTGEN